MLYLLAPINSFISWMNSGYNSDFETEVRIPVMNTKKRQIPCQGINEVSKLDLTVQQNSVTLIQYRSGC